MARCADCGEHMHAVKGCTIERFTDFSDGIDRVRVRYGDETRLMKPQPNQVCHDCLAHQGEFHHSGCDMEECPKCHKQAIACKCTDEESV